MLIKKKKRVLSLFYSHLLAVEIFNMYQIWQLVNSCLPAPWCKRTITGVWLLGLLLLGIGPMMEAVKVETAALG